MLFYLIVFEKKIFLIHFTLFLFHFNIIAFIQERNVLIKIK